MQIDITEQEALILIKESASIITDIFSHAKHFGGAMRQDGWEEIGKSIDRMQRIYVALPAQGGC